MSDLEYYCQRVTDHSPLVVSDVPGYGGYLVQSESAWAVVDYDLCSHTPLPAFICTEENARAYIATLDNTYRDGQKEGEQNFKKRVANFFSLSQQEMVDFHAGEFKDHTDSY